MKIKHKLTALALSATALTANAQTEDFHFGRSEYQQETSTNSHAHKAPRRIGSQATAPIKAQGEPNIPIVLVQFADTKFTTYTDADSLKAYYDLYSNGDAEGNGASSNLGSIRSYFAAQSDSAFMPKFEVVALVTLANPVSTYGTNSGNSKDTGYAGNFISQAITEAQNQYGTDWSKFDNNNDGVVDMTFFVFAGLGEHNGGGASTIWAKQNNYSPARTINGIQYSAFCCDSELAPSAASGGVITATTGNGIGVFVHEFSHALGLPDFYLTVGDSYVTGMDLWSVMDYGQYAGNGFRPMGYNAYERDFMGWQSLEELKEPQIVTLLPFARGGKGYKIVNENNANEYYILENKQPEGWEIALRNIGSGLLVTHVDYNASRWNNNTVNNDSAHQRMTFIAASNSYENIVGNRTSTAAWIAALAAHLYPGTTLNYNLTDTSLPASEVYAGGYMSKPIRNITENADGTITLCYRTNGQLSAPTLTTVADSASQQQIIVKWDAVDNATQYAARLISGSDTLTTTGITATEYTFASIPTGSQVSISIQAKADSEEDYLSSKWSEVSALTTGIEALSTQHSALSTQIYDLSGRPVSNTAKRGIYIKNGKKIIN